MMVLRFIRKSIIHYRRQHLAVFAATVVAVATLTGALLIGDSVRYSLKRNVGKRLGNTRVAVVSGSGYFGARLAKDLNSATGTHAAPVLLLRGIALDPESGERLNRVQVNGTDAALSFFSLVPQPDIGPGEALVSRNVARRLGLEKGDGFLLRVEKATVLPANMIFAREEPSSAAIRLTVAGIAGDSALGGFSLQNNQVAPYNVFVSREFLAKQMGLDSLANVVLVAGAGPGDLLAERVKEVLKDRWDLRDASLRITRDSATGIFDLTSDRIFIGDPVTELVPNLQVPHRKILTYLVNRLVKGGRETPYSFVASVASEADTTAAAGDTVLINRWLADDLEARPGDSLLMEYFVIGPWRRLSTKSARFLVSGVIPTDGRLNARMLMPDIPGLSDAGSCRSWNSGIPVDLGRIRDKDELYWNRYRGSPKAFIPFSRGRELWSNPFGSCTAIRFEERDISADSLAGLLLRHLDPGDFGITVVPVRDIGMAAADESVDFGSLFLYLSFFIIAGSLLLLILIHALNTEIRRSETGVLASLGYTRRKIVAIRLAESLPVIAAGGLAGAAASAGYARFLLAGLNTIWQDAVNLEALSMHISWQTVSAGILAGILLAMAAVGRVTVKMLKDPAAGLVRQLQESGNSPSSRSARRYRDIAAICILASLGAVLWSVTTGAYQQAGLYLAAGGLFMAASLSFLYFLMLRTTDRDRTSTGLLWLAWKNTGRNPARSLTVILILAIGVFAVFITGAYRKTYWGTGDQVKSGTGGYQLWAETTVPLPDDLNSPGGKARLIVENDSDLHGVRFLQFPGLEGDDASCLNLNRVEKPGILGVLPGVFDSRGSFSFARLIPGIDKEHPWISLDREFGPDVYPAFADQTVIQYGMKKRVGDTLTYADEYGRPFRLILAGGLENSVFQGKLLIADRFLRNKFPSAAENRIMLAETPSGREDRVASVLRNSLSDYGIEITTASARLSEFNSVENTYLTVFMMLGGLGLLIGTFGIGFLLVRNILERKHELALLSAVGYRKDQLIRLVWSEYFLLLLAGILAGSISALIGILPSLVTPSFTLEPSFLLTILVLILLSGSLCIWFSAKYVLQMNLILSLREDR